MNLKEENLIYTEREKTTGHWDFAKLTIKHVQMIKMTIVLSLKQTLHFCDFFYPSLNKLTILNIIIISYNMKYSCATT